MPSWEEVQKMIRDAQTPQEKSETARALAEQIQQKPELRGKILSTMRKGSSANVVSLDNLPVAMQNPEVYEMVKKAVTGGK